MLPRHRSTAWLLALAGVVLALYASLYPFEGWRWPPGADAARVLALPWPQFRDRFDQAANFAGYLPLGALFFVALVRSGVRALRAFAGALAVAALLAYGVEVAQAFVPGRVPSLEDGVLNLLGATAGAAIALGLNALGWIDRWHALRERWFATHSAAALVLLLLWPVALLFPTPVPLGVGAVWGEAAGWLSAALEGTPWAETVAAWVEEARAVQAPPTRMREGTIVALGLLAPAMLAYATSHPGWHRVALALGALGLAVGVSALSAALNFGPEHALAWWSPTVGAALPVATALAILLAPVSERLAAALALAVLVALVVLVAQVSADPYYAASLQGWEQGRFIRFHGLAQWVGWLWPYAAMVWLLARREP